jgi:hypothetical protein
MEDQSMDEPYFVEVDENGCTKCGAGRMWTVIGPDGDQHHTSFADEDDAAKLAEDLNDAYYKGNHEKQRDVLPHIPCKHVWSDSPDVPDYQRHCVCCFASDASADAK